jgi:hypothetical protein
VLCRFYKLWISIATLKHPRWVKFGTLFYATVDTLKQTCLLQPGHTKKTQKQILSFKSKENKTEKVKTIGLPPVKRFHCSHIARIHTLFLQDGKVSWGHFYLWTFIFFLGKCSIHYTRIPWCVHTKQNNQVKEPQDMETITTKSHLLPMHWNFYI